MKYFVLVWTGLWRKRARTIFTMLSIVAAFLLYGLLQAVDSGFENVSGNLNAKNRLYVANRNSTVEGIPMSGAQRIAALKGVTGVSYLAYFGGFYRDRRGSIGAFAADVPALLKLYDDVKIPKEQLEAMRVKRTGAIVARPLAVKYGWKIGDTIPVGTSLWTRKDGLNTYDFELVGIFDLAGGGTGVIGPNSFFVNFDYFDEARAFGTGRVDFMIVGADDASRVDGLARGIEELFANSGSEVKAESEQAFLGNQLKQVADIRFIVNAIVGAVLATLLFLTGNTMMQSMRERIPELAVLKTLGYTDAKVSALLLSEALLLCLFSAAIGLILARLSFVPVGRVFGNMQFSPMVLYSGIALAVVLALATGTPPALRAKFLKVTDALAGR